MPPSSSDSSSSDAETVWTANEGDSSENDEEVPAVPSIRGIAALVTASCPRRYPRDREDRVRMKVMIPEDFSTSELLQKFRRTVLANSTVKLVKGTCHDEPHKRFRPSADRRERHKHLPILMSGSFAHKKLADAFHKEHGLRISFSFHLKRFNGNLRYCMEAGKKPSTDLDMQPARFPGNLDLQAEREAPVHPGEAPKKEAKRRKRLSFDEVSNVIIEGVGDGPLKTGKALEQAAKKLKHSGQVELWNYIGELKSALEVNCLVAKAWRLHGENMHPMWRVNADYDLDKFDFEKLAAVKAWRNGKHASHTLILSGDGGLGKTNLAEALLNEKCPQGYWFVDDPDDFRELEGLLEPGQGILIDEVTLSAVPPNQIKKLFDTEKAGIYFSLFWAVKFRYHVLGSSRDFEPVGPLRFLCWHEFSCEILRFQFLLLLHEDRGKKIQPGSSPYGIAAPSEP
jgi:hypothetical protein